LDRLTGLLLRLGRSENFDLSRGQRSLSTNKVKGLSLSNIIGLFLPIFLSQLPVPFSHSLVKLVQLEGKMSITYNDTQSPTAYRISVCLYWKFTYRHSSDHHWANQGCCYVPSAVTTIPSTPIPPTAAMVTTYLQYLLSLSHRLHIHQHRRCLRLSILFLHRALTV
jgi:hypothetical protein